MDHDAEHARLVAAVETARVTLAIVRAMTAAERAALPNDDGCLACAEGDVERCESDLAWFLHRRDGDDG